MGICCLSGLTILFYFFVKNHLTTSMPRRHSRRRQTHGSLMPFGPRKWNTLFWKLCTVRKFFVCRSVYVYIQSPPLLSVRTVNNTQGISVQGAQTSSPPPSPIHVKQCTLYSRDNCRGRRIYLRGFYTVCVAFQCGLLPKKHCKGWDYRVSHKLPTLHHRTLVKWQPDLQAEKRMRDVNFISPKPLSSNSQSLFSTPL